MYLAPCLLSATFESMAPTQRGSLHAARQGAVTRPKGRGEKVSRKRSHSTCLRELSALSQPPFCGAKKQRRVAPDNRLENTVPQSTPFQNGGAIHGT